MSTAEIKAAVPEKYAQAALDALPGPRVAGPTVPCGTADPISSTSTMLPKEKWCPNKRRGLRWVAATQWRSRSSSPAKRSLTWV